jgi:hypothetical protein
MSENESTNEKVLDLEKVRKRLGPEGRTLLYSLFFGLALAPALAFLIFQLAGTVPEGYTVQRFYSDVRRDLMTGVWVAWALVLSPYALVQVFRILRWALRATRESISFPWDRGTQ